MTERRELSARERVRFQNLLRVAAESPFAGERANALAAAERLVARCGMTLDEAARSEPPHPTVHSVDVARRARWAEAARAVRIDDEAVRAEKARWEQAMQDAIARGLDRAERRAEERARNAPRREGRMSSKGRDRFSFARVLLAETALTLREVASITGLNVYQVVGLKLKMRSAVA